MVENFRYCESETFNQDLIKSNQCKLKFPNRVFCIFTQTKKDQQKIKKSRQRKNVKGILQILQTKQV